MTDLLTPFKAGSVVILGKRGSGKTTLARSAAAFRKSGLLIDAMGDVPIGRPVSFRGLNGWRPGWRRLNVPEEASKSGVGIDVLAAASFNAVLGLARAGLLPRPFTLFVDEADRYGSAAWNNAALRELARYGRHWGVSTIVTARRYAEIPKDWTGNADLVLVGPSLDPADAEFVNRLVGSSGCLIWRYLAPWDFLGKYLDGLGVYSYSPSRGAVDARSIDSEA